MGRLILAPKPTPFVALGQAGLLQRFLLKIGPAAENISKDLMD